MRISGSACEDTRRAFCILDMDFLIYKKLLHLGCIALNRYIHFTYRRVEICIIYKQKPVLMQHIFYGNTKENVETSTDIVGMLLQKSRVRSWNEKDRHEDGSGFW